RTRGDDRIEGGMEASAQLLGDPSIRPGHAVRNTLLELSLVGRGECRAEDRRDIVIVAGDRLATLPLLGPLDTNPIVGELEYLRSLNDELAIDVDGVSDLDFIDVGGPDENVEKSVGGPASV